MMTINRYHRQMLLPGVGEAGQSRLAGSHALLIGCGALGCTVADLLVRAGVGMLTIVDRDIVELTNLQRQSLFDERDVSDGLPKAVAAQRRLAAINSEVRVRAIVADFTADNAERIAAGEQPGEDSDNPHSTTEKPEAPAQAVQIIIDGTDNFETRYLMNDLAIKLGIPYIYGGAVGSRGMQMTIRPGGRPCLRCLFDEAPAPGSTPTCDTAGIFGPVASIVASCEAAAALRYLMKAPDESESAQPQTLLDFDLWTGHRRRLDVAQMARPDCPCCGQNPPQGARRFEFLDGGRASGTTTLCGRGSVQLMPRNNSESSSTGGRIDLESLARRLAAHGRFASNRFLMRGEFAAERGDEGNPLSITIFPDGRAIVHGTTDASRARAIYARYIGS